jgi:signal transduction histidine kinase
MSNEEIITAILISIAFVVLVVLFCVLLIKLYIKKIKEHNAKQLAFQKTLNETVMETYEQAASNISSDLHDDVGQQLTVINLQLEHLKYDSPDLEVALNPVSESLSTLSQSIRSISHSLNNQLVVQQRTGIAVTFVIEPKTRKEFTTNEKIIIYRIFQECINNSFKHAKASSIDVAIRVTPRFEMTITDNGVGFNTLKSNKKTSLGLLSMNSRASAIGYTLTIASTPNKGTTITLFEDITN